MSYLYSMRNDKKERILRILLNKENLTKYRIAKLSNCSPSWVYMFLKDLKNKKLITDSKIEYKEIFEYWLSIHKQSKFREYMIKDPLQILGDVKLEYVMTTYLAENILQSYLFPLRYDFYIKSQDLEKWHLMLTGKGFYGKGNVRLLIAEDDSVFYNKGKFQLKIADNKQFYMASLPQVIIDLLAEGGPAKEAGYMLIKGFYEDVREIRN